MNASHHLIFLLVFVCIILNLTVSPEAEAQDTTNVVFDDPYMYPLSDPRNPDCPCHKQQRLADEEFANLTGRGRGSRHVAPVIETQSSPLLVLLAIAQQTDQAAAGNNVQAGRQTTKSNGLRTFISKTDHWLYKNSKRFKQNLVGSQRVGKKLKKCFLF